MCCSASTALLLSKPSQELGGGLKPQICLNLAPTLVCVLLPPFPPSPLPCIGLGSVLYVAGGCVDHSSLLAFTRTYAQCAELWALDLASFS